MYSGSISPSRKMSLYIDLILHFNSELSTAHPKGNYFFHQSFSPTHAPPSWNSITFNQVSLISHLIFSSVSSWTRLGSGQSEDIISDYNSCGRRLLSQLLVRKCQPSSWVPAAAFISFQIWGYGRWMHAWFTEWAHWTRSGHNVSQRN